MSYQVQAMQSTTTTLSHVTPVTLMWQMNCRRFQGDQKHKTQEDYNKDMTK